MDQFRRETMKPLAYTMICWGVFLMLVLAWPVSNVQAQPTAPREQPAAPSDQEGGMQGMQGMQGGMGQMT
jgi:hypothetical protein